MKCFLKVYQDKGIDEASEYTQRAFKFFGTKGIPGRPNKPKLLPSISTIIPDRFPSQANQSHDDLQDHPQATARTLPPLRPVQGNAANTTSTHAVHDENTRESSPDPLRTFFGYERCDYSRGPSSYAWESPQPSFTAMRITDSRTQAESEVQTAAPRPATPSIAPPARDAVIEGPVKAGMYWRCPHPWCVMRGPDATEEDCEQHMIHEHGRDG